MAVWLENDAPWYEERMIYCGTCGRMIAKRYLWEGFPHGEATFCGEECLELYRSYVLAERGPGYRPPDDIDTIYADLMVR
jgi:hypothetical protein